ncbi:MAG: transposase [Alphaproteobacteria bacterium]|nr:transposase [Alphaproteobacteria bacterium]
MDFVAIDVETANNEIESICQIGITTYSNGKLIHEWSSLINPQSDFGNFNIKIHGIQPHDVKDAPTFAQAYPEFSQLLSNKYIVSHTFFDRTAINNSIQKHGLPPIENNWIDTVKVARKTWGHIPLASYGLANVCQFIGFKFNHHDALEDAKACGAIMSAALLDTDTKPADWYTPPTKTKPKPKKKTKKSEFPTPNPQGALIGHTIAFTGKLSVTRSKAAQLAADHGCILSKYIQWHTNYLVIGSSTKNAVGKSSKQIQAEAFNNQGHNIRILTEQDFKTLIGKP